MKIHFEKLTHAMGAPLLTKEIRGKTFTAPLHFHPEIELTLILKSSGKRFVGDSIQCFGPGDLVLLGENLPHYWSNVKDPYTNESTAHAIVVQFSTSFLGKEFMELSGANHIAKLLKSSARGICIKKTSRDIIAKKLVEILHLETFRKVLTILEILDEISKSKHCHLLASPYFKPYLSTEDCKKMDKVLNFVYNNLTSTLNISAIADSVNMSESGFCHYFKKRTQRTFTQFVNEIRIGKAKRLLIESDDSVAEISYACGFNAISHFNKQFYSLAGSPPTVFRKNYQ